MLDVWLLESEARDSAGGESCYEETDEAAKKRASLCGAHMDFQHRDLKLVRYTHLV